MATSWEIFASVVAAVLTVSQCERRGQRGIQLGDIVDMRPRRLIGVQQVAAQGAGRQGNAGDLGFQCIRLGQQGLQAGGQG
ncbi:MAG: hypothetical protein AAB263_12415 [Planctomycetota bacterium]